MENNLECTPVENLSAWIGLYGSDGEIIASQVAVGPLNILRPGAGHAFDRFFSAPIASRTLLARAELLTAIEIPEDDGRYLDWQLGDLGVDVRGDQLQEARVTGMLAQPVEKHFYPAKFGLWRLLMTRLDRWWECVS